MAELIKSITAAAAGQEFRTTPYICTWYHMGQGTQVFPSLCTTYVTWLTTTTASGPGKHTTTAIIVQ